MIELSEVYFLEGLKALGKKHDRCLKVEVDNRCLNSNSLFIAIKGEKFNPMNHLESVVDSGCEFVLFEKDTVDSLVLENFQKKINFFEVDNIEKAIAQVGMLVAAKFREGGGKILAISGSNGKTTTKEMTKFIADQVLGTNKTICTQKNNNNHLGVPFTLFQITEETEFAIVELGSNARGEIEFLCQILRPQFGVTTNIGDTHLEFFQTRENVFHEEAVLSKYCCHKFFKNSDDEYLKGLEVESDSVSFGRTGKDYKFELGGDFICVNDHRVENSNLTGAHNFTNLGVAILVLKEVFELELDMLSKVASDFTPTSNRSEWIELKGKKIFLDAYNANPSSMKAALEGFFQKIAPIEPSQVCVVLGDMNELGALTEDMHQELGEFTAQFNVHSYIFVGQFSKNYLKGCSRDNAIAVNTTDDASLAISKLAVSVKYLFIKGSRSLQLERILDIK